MSQDRIVDEHLNLTQLLVVLIRTKDASHNISFEYVLFPIVNTS